jgi:hypothetical protein
MSLIGDLSVWIHYTRKLGKPGLGSDEWDDSRGAKSHAVRFGGRTLCGHDVGTIREGWARDEYARSADVSVVDCRGCRRSLESGQGVGGDRYARGW